MKKWKFSIKSTCLPMLTAVLIMSGANHITMPVQAKGMEKESSAYKSLGEEKLTANEKKIYDQLKLMASQVASGKRVSTTISVDDFSSLRNSKEEIGAMMDRVTWYLLSDCPYELYWYDKNKGYSCQWTASDDGRILSMSISLAVSQDYQGTALYAVDTVKTEAAAKTMEKAGEIVARHQYEGDYDKLRSYMTEICNLVSYNWDVYEDSSVPYGNPWQPIWVFDGADNTNVVCEGYAKAFQYLCDLSTFRDAACYTVGGTTSAGTGSGDHMWNIVTLEGVNYLVDITNCDSGSIGEPDQLFLAGAEGSAENGYTVSLNGGHSITYGYQENQAALFGDILELSPYFYRKPEELKLRITAPTAEEVTFGDPVDNQILTGGRAVNGKGEEVTGTFSWEEEVTFYGTAGTNTLEAVFTPDSSQYQPVENIRVSVKINPRPVTVTAERKNKVYGQPDPELTYTYSNVVEGYPLSGSLTRTAGENVGTYEILQGDLTDRNNPNYTITFTGNNLVINPSSNSSIEFMVGSEKASAANGVTVKGDASYGDLWSEIVKIGSITAKSQYGSDNNPGHFTLQESGSPGVGGGQSFHVLYNGTIGGETYRNEVVLEGRADVKRRTLQVSAGSYKVTKPYDRTRAGGTASGQLSLNNLLSADANRVTVTAAPAGYTDANVSGQSRMTVNLTLSGAGADNYELASNTIEVPCQITPKTITPTVKVSGGYTYNGRAITPAVTVADGTDVLAASDYDLVLSNNRNAGTAKVSVSPRNGGNYTWSPAVEASFTIEKAVYKGTRTGTASMEYGGTAIFSLVSMLPEDYRLGDIRVEDKDGILGDTPAISGKVLACKLVNDRSKEGKSAIVTLPVAESINYHPYDLIFTVTMAPQRSKANNQAPTSSGGESGIGQTPAAPSPATTDIPDGQAPASGYGDTEAPDSASVTPLERENSKSGRRGDSMNMAPAVGIALGVVLAGGVVGGACLIRRKRKMK